MPFLFGLLAAAAALAITSRSKASSDVPELELVPPAAPFAGPLAVGMIAVLIAKQRTIEGAAPNLPFKVQIVGLPDATQKQLTGVLLAPVSPARTGDMLQFLPTYVSNVVPS